MQSALKKIEQQHANAFQNTLVIPMWLAGQSVPQMQNVPQTKLAETRSVLILVLDYVE
jgi:hypothetical protein